MRNKTIKPHYITDTNGQKLSVILPIATYLELLDDIEDLAAIAERKDESTFDFETVLQELNL